MIRAKFFDVEIKYEAMAGTLGLPTLSTLNRGLDELWFNVTRSWYNCVTTHL